MWKHEISTANLRESTRIAFSLRCLLVLVVLLLGRVPTLRLIGSAWPERQRGKCWKTRRVAGFLLRKSCPLLLLQVFENLERKPATRVFQHFSFRRPGHAEPIRRSVGTRPKVKRAEQEKCDSRRFAIIRGGILIYPHPTNSFPNLTLSRQILPPLSPFPAKKSIPSPKCKNRIPAAGPPLPDRKPSVCSPPRVYDPRLFANR